MSDSKSIDKQGKRVKELTKKIKEGKISLEELNELSTTLNELSDKVAVLKYMTAKNDFEVPDLDPIEASVTEIEEEEPVQNIIEEAPEVVEEVEAPKEESKPAFSFNLFDSPSDSDESDTAQETQLEEKNEDAKEEEEMVSEEESITIDQLTPAEESFDSAQEPTKNSTPNESSPKSGLAAAMEEKKSAGSLNDNYFGVEDNSLANKLKNTPIANLKSAIGINVKFTFINELFGGNADEFNQSVDTIDGMNSADDARKMLGDLSGKHNWDLESKPVSQFVEMVERRFM